MAKIVTESIELVSGMSSVNLLSEVLVAYTSGQTFSPDYATTYYHIFQEA